jgi:hypothetical protein
MKFLSDTLVAFVMLVALSCALIGCILAWMGICVMLVGPDWFLLPWSVGMLLATAAAIAGTNRCAP